MTVEPFVRGCAWPGTPDVPYPRADPADMARLPVDTWGVAQIPVGVRLELVGDAEAVEIDYACATDDLGYRGAGAGTTFTLWRGDELLDEQPAELGRAQVRLSFREPIPTSPPRLDAGPAEAVSAGVEAGSPGSVSTRDIQLTGAVTVHLPEGMRPTVLAVRGVGGTIEPAPPGPRWLCYGDSIAEGWAATGPGRAWPAIAARRWGLDVVNLGYAGAARGEIVSAEQLAALPADVVSLTHGTNCWSRIPHSLDQVRAGMTAFLDVVRQGHPTTPIVVGSPVVRPDAESTPNRLGATLSGMRQTIEEVVTARQDAGDGRITLVPGGPLLGETHLVDGVHPGDEGHAILAAAFGGAVVAAAAGRHEAA